MPERKKIEIIHTRNLKQTLSHGLVLKKVHRIIRFNQKAVSEPKTLMNDFITIMYLGLLILEISKIVMYKFWYDYMEPKYGEKANHVT